MKKIFFVALAATLLAAGCQKTEIINHVGDSIGFATDLSKITKATGVADAEKTGMVNLLAQDFRVWAYYVADDPNTGALAKSVYDGMEDAIVLAPGTIKDGTTEALNGWTPDKEYYWPGKGKDLKFFAVSGVEEKKAKINDNRDAVTIEGFEVAPTAANVDLMVADFVQQNQGDNKGEVALSFNHALSKIEFLFKTREGITEKIHVQKLEIGEATTESGTTTVTGGLINKGTLTVTTENTTFGTATSDIQCAAKLAWSTTGMPEVAFEDDWTTPASDFPAKIVKVGAVNNEETAPSDEDKQAMLLTTKAEPFTTWLMIPQSVSTKKVTVTYLIDKRQFKAIFPLYLAGTLTDWAVNQYVKYTVTLAPNKITFSANVKPWAPNGTDGTTDDAGLDIELGEEDTPETPATPATPEAKEYEVAKIGTNDATAGTKITINQVGDSIAVNDTTEAANGTYTLKNGIVVVVTDGKVTEVNTPETGGTTGTETTGTETGGQNA